MNSTIAMVLGALYGLSEVGLSLFKRSRGSSDTDGGSLRVLWITIIISISLAIFVARVYPAARFPFVEVLQYTGLAIFVGGLVLRWTAILWLGKFFTVNVNVAEDHRVIDDGPYRLIRHPSYTGAIAAFLGFGLCTGNWLATAIVVIPVTWAMLRRIRLEERVLNSALGDAYRNYSLRTKRLIPLIY
jgi:protein-S-isoprenylcysteine O-methyltransferase